ncbi:MAG: hypothetical protein E7019_06000 [Alphaproteobacteria bacterium]|nr:hypothetical protein [Alphaproteobacteria bacterium]
MIIVGIESGRLGSDNQTRGIILEVSKGKDIPVTKSQLLRSVDGKLLHRSQYPNDIEFRRAVFKTLSVYYNTLQDTGSSFPDYFAIPFDQSKPKDEECESIDLLTAYIKDFAKHKGISTKAIALTSCVYDYQNVDLIHVGRHQMSRADEILIKKHPELKDRLIITDGVPSNLNWINIEMQANSPQKSAELAKFKDKEVALFSLGGKTSNGDIDFTISDAQKLLEGAKKLKSQGYQVIFTNSPRTPNNVTDFLYEACKANDFAFYNSKRITDNAQEAIDNFTIYHGKYNQEFKQQAQNIGGNIYPAILSLCRNKGFVVNTWDSFSYTSDAAALGITSVVYNGNYINTTRREDCKRLLDNCRDAGYIKIFDDDFINLSNEDKKTKIMPIVNKVICKEMQKRTTPRANMQQNIALSKKQKDNNQQ